jgi:transcriptional regulator with XRE-family HTH domain
MSKAKKSYTPIEGIYSDLGICDKLKELIKCEINGKVLTKANLAEIIGVSRPTVSGWFSGDSTPTASAIKSICELYNVSPDWIFGYSVIRTLETDKRIAIEVTGFTEKAIENLISIYALADSEHKIDEAYICNTIINARTLDWTPDSKAVKETLDFLFSSEQFWEFICTFYKTSLLFEQLRHDKNIFYEIVDTTELDASQFKLSRLCATIVELYGESVSNTFKEYENKARKLKKENEDKL